MTFGSKIINFNDLSSEEQKAFLLENKVISKMKVLPVQCEYLENSASDLTSSDNGEKPDLYDFIYNEFRLLGDISKMIEREVILNPYKNDLYFYLVFRYSDAINLELLKYRINSNEDLIGVDDFNDQKRIVLDYFKDYFNSILGNRILQMKPDNLSGPGRVENYFHFLIRERENFKESLVNERELIFNYLAGNKDYFDGFLINSNSFLKEMILFESKLKVLVLLNTKYNFYENDYFTLIPHLDQFYIELKDELFLSPVAIEFIGEFLSKKENVTIVKISCLFYALQEYDLIKDKKKLYIDFINSAFNNPFPNSEIRYFDKSPEDINRKRIKKYKEDLQAYIELTRSIKS